MWGELVISRFPSQRANNMKSISMLWRQNDGREVHVFQLKLHHAMTDGTSNVGHCLLDSDLHLKYIPHPICSNWYGHLNNPCWSQPFQCSWHTSPPCGIPLSSCIHVDITKGYKSLFIAFSVGFYSIFPPYAGDGDTGPSSCRKMK